jgi:hypothetical protein
MNEVNLLRRGGGIIVDNPPPRHLPSAGKLIRLHLRCSLIRATPPGQEGSLKKTPSAQFFLDWLEFIHLLCISKYF